jgi:hypothetical protein
MTGNQNRLAHRPHRTLVNAADHHNAISMNHQVPGNHPGSTFAPARIAQQAAQNQDKPSARKG